MLSLELNLVDQQLTRFSQSTWGNLLKKKKNICIMIHQGKIIYKIWRLRTPVPVEVPVDSCCQVEVRRLLVKTGTDGRLGRIFKAEDKDLKFCWYYYSSESIDANIHKRLYQWLVIFNCILPFSINVYAYNCIS